MSNLDFEESALKIHLKISSVFEFLHRTYSDPPCRNKKRFSGPVIGTTSLII